MPNNNQHLLVKNYFLNCFFNCIFWQFVDNFCYYYYFLNIIVMHWNTDATYQNIIRICDREGCFLEISAICWSNGQSHS